MKQDRNFDDLAKKFDANIYGTSKGQLRHELLLHHLKEHVLNHAQDLHVLDAGGGTGEMTRSLSELGHCVTLNDLSADSLSLAKEKCKDFPRTRYLNGAIADIPEVPFDLVVCHAVLEWVSDPSALINDLIARVKPNGYLSLSFYNYDAQVFGNLLYGNFEFVASGMKRRNQVRLTPHSPAKPKDILNYFDSLPVEVIHKAGIRCIHDYLKDNQMATSKYDELYEMEVQFGSQEPYMWFGKYFHVIVKATA